MSIVFHNDPVTPFDRRPITHVDSPGYGSGNRRSVAVPAEYIPTAVDAAKLRVGARQLDPAQWVSTPDADWLFTQVMKMQLINERPREVIAFDDVAKEACEEASRGVLNSLNLSESDQEGIDALVDAAAAVADDLCILIPDEHGVPRLRAAVLCSPNRWRLADKMGGTMASIHAPVARYDEDLQSPVDAVIARLNPERPLWRVNWGIANHPSLFQPDIPPATPEMDPADMWFRIEWQTLRKLPESGGVLFTIRTYVEQLRNFFERDYDIVHDFGDIVNKIPENVAQYKSIAPYRDALFAYLSSR